MPSGMPFIELQSVDSTNNYALARLHEARLPDRQGPVQHGQAYFAHEQVAGKGQRGRVWEAEKDANIILSVVLNPYPLQLSQQFQFSAAVAMAVHDFFSNYAGEDTKIKWPNDLYWQDRKAGGVLIESVISSYSPVKKSGLSENERQKTAAGQWQWAVVGIGININQTSFPEELKNPVSLKQITGKNYDVVALAKELCERLYSRFSELTQKGFDSIYHNYNSQLYKQGEPVRLKKDSRVFEAIIKNVSPAGQLIVQHSIEEAFGFGDIEWIIK
jgi:BirA family biotin operon repressor/biotin-[acetyl-CoA-carboxylase] ligase